LIYGSFSLFASLFHFQQYVVYKFVQPVVYKFIIRVTSLFYTVFDRYNSVSIARLMLRQAYFMIER